MAWADSNLEGIYASPQNSRSGSFSELGLTLLPSTSGPSDTSPRENHGYGGFQSRRYEGPQSLECNLGGSNYPSPTPTQLENSDDFAAKRLVNVSNSDHRKQPLSTVTNSSTASLFVPLCPVDRSGRPQTSSVTPTYITTPLQYRPSAPHLHTLVSTGTTLAAAAQLDHLKERNKHLTMERDRYYHLSKPATLRADDMKSEQIRQLQTTLKEAVERNEKLETALQDAIGRNVMLQWALDRQNTTEQNRQLQAELRDATVRNHRLECMLQHETARANDALATAAKRTDQYEKLVAVYNMRVTANPFTFPNSQNPLQMSSTTPYPAGEDILHQESTYIDLTSPKRPTSSQQSGTQNRGAQPVIVMPSIIAQTQSSASGTAQLATVTQAPPPAPGTETSSKRQRIGSTTEKQPANEPPPKRQRTGSSTIEKQPRKQQSLANRSQFNDIQARVRSALKRKTVAYTWLKENENNEAEVANEGEVVKGMEATNGGEVGNGGEITKEVDATNRADTTAEDELSESEIAAFDRALEEAWDEGEGEGGGRGGEGDGESLFGDT